jgi:hypothetical protein
MNQMQSALASVARQKISDLDSGSSLGSTDKGVDIAANVRASWWSQIQAVWREKKEEMQMGGARTILYE